MPCLKRKDKTPRVDETDRILNIPYLASLCQAAEQGNIEFYSSFELAMERLRQRGPDDGYLGLDLMRNISLKDAESPITRTIVIDGFGRNFGITEEEQMTFFKKIQDPEFQNIAKHFSHNQIDDAYHLWTAEKNKLDIFLTMDSKFVNSAKQEQRHLNMNAKAMLPADLCKSLNLRPLNLEDLKN